MQSSKSLSKVNETTKAVSTDVVSDWGSDVYLGVNDIIIPKILPMQGLSQMVTDGKAMMGEFRDSLSGEKLGSITEPIAVVPFHVEKVWDILEESGDQFKWVRSEPLIEDPTKPGYNDNLPWNDKVDGLDFKRIRRMNFYVMLPKQIDEGSAVPYVLSFKSTSYREGKKLFTQMYMRNRKANLPPPGYTIVLSGVKQKNDKGTFVVPSLELGPLTPASHIAECLNWYKLIKKGSVKVDASEEETIDVSGVADAGTGDY